MKKENPFNHKAVKKTLFATYRNQLPAGRRTRTYLRCQARNIEHAYELGHRDGLAGKAMILLEESQKGDNSPLAVLMVHHAYTAYQAGYLSGKKGVREG